MKLKLFTQPKFHLILLSLLLLTVFVFWHPQLIDDGVNYQNFATKIVNEGRVDLSIPGFHGADFFVAIVYLFTRSMLSVYLVDMAATLALVWVIYLTVKELFHNTKLGVLASYLYVLMPFEHLNALRGGHQTVFFLFSLLALYFLFKEKKYAWLFLGFSYIIKPFSIVLAPFFLYKRKFSQLALSFIFPVVNIIAQYAQIGRIIIGRHPGLTAGQLFDPSRFIQNLIYAAQNYFSIHNFSPLNPVYLMDMVHLSPLVTFFAALSIGYYQKYFADRKLFYALFSSATLAYLLPCSFYRLDMWYLGIFNLLLIFIALPALDNHPRLWPLLVFTFSFQFYYFFLSYRQLFYWGQIVFIIPLAVFIVSLYYAISRYRGLDQQHQSG
jgi:hypothetical protein